MTTIEQLITTERTKTWISPVWGAYFYNAPGKVYHRKCMATLNKEAPTKNDLLALGNTCLRAGIPLNELIEIIDKHNTWEIMPNGNQYDKSITETYLRHIEQYSIKGGGSSGGCQGAAHLPKITYTSDKLIEIFLNNFQPFEVPHINLNPAIAARQYISVKIPALPRNKKVTKKCNEKCHKTNFCKHQDFYQVPSWKRYKDEVPTLSEVSRLDYNAGVCLIGTHQIGFLDIDVKSEVHPEGITNFNISMFNGYHIEKSKNGGYHIFGRGEYKDKPVVSSEDSAVKIIGYGGLIVSAPTPGYDEVI